MSTTEMTKKNKGVEAVYAALDKRFFHGLRPGTQEQLGRHLGISKQAVNQWSKVPAEHVISICDLLDLEPEVLRPDIFKKRKLKK